MKVERNDLSLILSSTSIPDVFFTEYLSQANGDYVKVYLYLYFISKYSKDIKLTDLAKKLEMNFKTIQDAIKYWESVGLLIKKNQGFIVPNVQEIELNKLYKPKVTISAEHIEEVSENKARSKAIDAINNEFFQGVMSPSWYSDIDLWFKKYAFSEDVMIALFRYCFDKSALHRNYVATVAEAWNKNGIHTFEDLDLYYEKQEKVKVVENSIKKKLRMTRNLSIYEEAYVEKWVMNYQYSMEIIDMALKKTTSKFNPSFEYIDKILTDWHDRGFDTKEKISEFLENQKSKPVQNLKENKSNFTQRKYNNLNSLYSNINN